MQCSAIRGACIRVVAKFCRALHWGVTLHYAHILHLHHSLVVVHTRQGKVHNCVSFKGQLALRSS